MKSIRAYPIFGALIAQIAAGLIVFAARMVLSVWAWEASLNVQILFWSSLAAQSIAAAVISRLIGLPVWWIWIGFCFPAAVTLALNAGDLPAWPFGVAFVGLYLFFSNTARERVPLYLSNQRTADALLSLMQQRGGRRFIDLGSGLGGVVRALAGSGRVARGVETAPMVWLMSAIVSKLTGRGRILRQDMWSTHLGQEDLVYMFLSTEPMSALYEKAKAEMKPGSLLVSNSFPVPGIEPDEVWELPDRRKTKLYLYKMGGLEPGRKTKPGKRNSA
ncbi:hypothetical protein [Hoeflea sp.]|uniref:hypothetical protein n=1 Tax=Hoeflea sp. TaxID=1940281 RepID=UPI003748F303